MNPPSKSVSPAPILLTTLNSSYAHSSFGLRYLLANMGDLKSQTQIHEFTILAQPRAIVEKILEYRPRIVGFGVYIWNTDESLKVVSILKKIAPEIIVVLGGPEVSFETLGQEIYEKADYVIQGEADFLFREFCSQVITGGNLPPSKIIRGPLPEVKELCLPYDLYTDEDIRNRMIYVEASRGCPYKCEYCLSSLDKSVRNFPVDGFLSEMEKLIARGVRQFKFVDRTFNLSVSISTQILEFFLSHIDKGLFLHFEMIPDRLPEELKKLIARFPSGSLQFEIGIQTFAEDVQKNVSRRNDFKKVEENFRFLREETGVHTHADLIVGLPGETMESFARGFDQLVKYGPDEIQVGILKRLKGTPLTKKEIQFQLNYSEYAPYEILSTSTMSFHDIQNMQRFARFWDLIGNSGQFPHSLQLLKRIANEIFESSFFKCFYELSQFAGAKTQGLHHLSLERVAEIIFDFLNQLSTTSRDQAAKVLIHDYCFSGKRRDLPSFLKSEALLYQSLKEEHLRDLAQEGANASPSPQLESLPARQLRHQLAQRALDKTASSIPS